MEHGVSIQSFIDNHAKLIEHYERRATHMEFTFTRYIIYLNFSCVVAMNPIIIDGLLRYGSDTLYPKLQWTDKL